MKLALVDIDGCLVDYPKVFLDWLEKEKEKSFDTLEQCKKELGIEVYEGYKLLYRLSDEKRYLKLIDGAESVLKYLKQKGFCIWLITTRPKMETVLRNTVYWIISNKLQSNNVIFTENKIEFIEQLKTVNILIDDDENILRRYNNTSIKCFDANWNETLSELKREYK